MSQTMNVERLTPREIDVVRLLANGCTYGRVAQRLGISEHTVTTHIKNTYRKLDVHCAAAAVMRAIQLRLIGEASSLLAYDGLREAP